MRLVCWNVNGVRACAAKGLSQVVEQLAPDILCLQEIKADADCVQTITTSVGFTDVYCSCAQKKGYSGVASCFGPKAPQALTTRYLPSSDFSDLEGRFVISECADFSLYNLYIPSGTSGEQRQGFKMQFLARLYDHLAQLSTAQRGRIILCGDFNICHKEVDIHHPREATKRKLTGFLPEERAWLDRLAALGFNDAFRMLHPEATQRYSWWSYRAGARKKNLGWRIDYFWLGQEIAKRLRGAEMHEDLLGSDHCPLSLELAQGTF
jgi:exodeoxyribonuclease-3